MARRGFVSLLPNARVAVARMAPVVCFCSFCLAHYFSFIYKTSFLQAAKNELQQAHSYKYDSQLA